MLVNVGAGAASLPLNNSCASQPRVAGESFSSGHEGPSSTSFSVEVIRCTDSAIRCACRVAMVSHKNCDALRQNSTANSQTSRPSARFLEGKEKEGKGKTFSQMNFHMKV